MLVSDTPGELFHIASRWSCPCLVSHSVYSSSVCNQAGSMHLQYGLQSLVALVAQALGHAAWQHYVVYCGDDSSTTRNSEPIDTPRLTVLGFHLSLLQRRSHTCHSSKSQGRVRGPGISANLLLLELGGRSNPARVTVFLPHTDLSVVSQGEWSWLSGMVKEIFQIRPQL